MHQSVWLESLPTKNKNEKQRQCHSVKPQMPVPTDLVVSEADLSLINLQSDHTTGVEVLKFISFHIWNAYYDCLDPNPKLTVS